MSSISLRSLVKEIFGVTEDDMTFEADYKKLQRMHRLFSGVTGKVYSTQIDESAKIEYVNLMKILVEKFATTDEGAQIEKIMRKQGKNHERLTLSKERLVEAGKIIGIDVIDHIVLGSDKFVSMKEKGYI